MAYFDADTQRSIDKVEKKQNERFVIGSDYLPESLKDKIKDLKSGKLGKSIIGNGKYAVKGAMVGLVVGFVASILLKQNKMLWCLGGILGGGLIYGKLGEKLEAGFKKPVQNTTTATANFNGKKKKVTSKSKSNGKRKANLKSNL